MITAMTFLLLLLAVAVLMGTDTVRRMWRDGSGPTQPPASHFQDPRFLSANHR
jgi:hypothetical protein